MNANMLRRWKDAETITIQEATQKRLMEQRFRPVMPPLVRAMPTLLEQVEAELMRLGLK